MDDNFEYDIEKDKEINKDNEFNPIKEQIGGKSAERVIWSTYSINKAVEALKKGLPLKANPFIGKNTKLLRADLVYKRTEEELEDYMHCMEDPIYFASKCFLMTPEGLQSCKLRDYQEDYLNHLRNNRFSILLACRQAGKSVTTAIYCLWVILFNTDKTGLILSKSGPAGRDLIKKIKDMYLYLPYHLKIGTLKWNQAEISFDNNSSISTESFSPTAGLGKTINFLILDEFAWCPPNDVELFYNNIIPTVTTISDSNVCIMSTQNGFNLFYKLWKSAIEKKSIYAPFKVDWYQVPQYNTKTKHWDKRDQKWKDEMVGILGSEEAFQYQYGTQFSASDKCLVSKECLAELRNNSILWENRIDELYEVFPNLFLNYNQYLFWDKDFDFNLLKTGWFILTIDLAEGANQDSTVFNIYMLLDNENLRHIGRWSSNELDLEHAALEFWLLAGQIFQNDKCIWSMEWNTYGALFYRILMDLNEMEYDTATNYRFNVIQDPTQGLDLYNFVMYKKTSLDDTILGKDTKSKTIPGIRINSSNKPTACSLLKIMFEKKQILTTDLMAIGELENFEDKNGNGSYKASFGHDDIIMTFVQLPLLKQTSRWKTFIEDYELEKTNNSLDLKWNNTPNLEYDNFYNLHSNYWV